jgi:hypothetical protein
VFELRAVRGAPVLYADGAAVAGTLDDLIHALPSLAGTASTEEVRWLGEVAIALASGMPQWPSRYALSKYIDYVGPSLSAELAEAFRAGLDAAFDKIRQTDGVGQRTGEVAVALMEWVADRVPTHEG